MQTLLSIVQDDCLDEDVNVYTDEIIVMRSIRY